MSNLPTSGSCCPTTARTGNAPSELPRRPRYDISETDQEFVVNLSLPGVDPANVEIHYEDGYLTVEVPAPEAVERQYLLEEMPKTGYYARFALSDTIDTEQIKASDDAGILSLHLPKIETAKARRITIGA